MKIRSWSVALLLLCSASSVMIGSPVPSDPPLFKVLPESPLPPHTRDPSIMREVAVEVNLDVARNKKTVLFPLFQGTAPLRLNLPKQRLGLDKAVIKSGRIDGQPASLAVVVAGKVLIADISTQVTREPATYYVIRYLGQGQHVLRQIDPSKLPEGADPIAPKEEDTSPDGLPCTTDPASLIDLLVVYTPEATAEAGDSSAMRQLIDDYIEAANESYTRSKIAQQIRLVRAVELPYKESGVDSDLDSLRNGVNGLADAHRFREESGADLVALIVSYTKSQAQIDKCGMSYIMRDPDVSFAERAFSVVPNVCATTGNWALTHELGHLMGARHDWWEGKKEFSPRKPYPYSHGYVHLSRSMSDPPPYFRTMMAKHTECGDAHQACDRVPYWSNPLVNYEGTNIPMGEKEEDTDEPSDNAKTLNQTASIVANFRCSKP